MSYNPTKQPLPPGGQHAANTPGSRPTKSTSITAEPTTQEPSISARSEELSKPIRSATLTMTSNRQDVSANRPDSRLDYGAVGQRDPTSLSAIPVPGPDLRTEIARLQGAVEMLRRSILSLQSGKAEVLGVEQSLSNLHARFGAELEAHEQGMMRSWTGHLLQLNDRVGSLAEDIKRLERGFRTLENEMARLKGNAGGS